VQGSTLPLFPQDLGFQSMAVKRTRERENIRILLFWRNCFAFTVELNGCGESGGKPKSNNSARIYAKTLDYSYVFNNSSFSITVLAEYVEVFPLLFPLSGRS